MKSFNAGKLWLLFLLTSLSERMWWMTVVFVKGKLKVWATIQAPDYLSDERIYFTWQKALFLVLPKHDWKSWKFGLSATHCKNGTRFYHCADLYHSLSSLPGSPAEWHFNAAYGPIFLHTSHQRCNTPFVPRYQLPAVRDIGSNLKWVCSPGRKLFLT